MELPLAALTALRAGVDLLNRLPQIERAVSDASKHAEQVLDEVLERVRPVQAELVELRESAESLQRELGASQRALDPLDCRIQELTTVAARLEGSLEHLLDRVPGLSPEDAKKRAVEITRSY